MKTRERRQKEGICVDCESMDLFEDKCRCEECHLRQSDISKERYLKRKNIGLCVRCGEATEGKEVSLCDLCTSKARKRFNKRVEESHSLGTCIDCKEKHLPQFEGKSQRYCEKHWFFRITRKNGFKSSQWEDLREILVKQNFTCPYTGDKLIIGVNASIDHIKPQSLYPNLANQLSNIEWVSLKVNIMKNNMEKEEFLELIRKIGVNIG